MIRQTLARRQFSVANPLALLSPLASFNSLQKSRNEWRLFGLLDTADKNFNVTDWYVGLDLLTLSVRARYIL